MLATLAALYGSLAALATLAAFSWGGLLLAALNGSLHWQGLDDCARRPARPTPCHQAYDALALPQLETSLEGRGAAPAPASRGWTSPFADLDWGAATDGEDLVAPLCDVFEFGEQERTLLYDRALLPALALGGLVAALGGAQLGLRLAKRARLQWWDRPHARSRAYGSRPTAKGWVASLTARFNLQCPP